MSDTIKAKVNRFPRIGLDAARGTYLVPWLTTVYVEREDPTEPIELYKFSWSSTVTKACQAAIEQRAEFEQLLMDEVHASRAARREQRCEECGERVPPGKAHWKINEGPCMILAADQIDPDTAEGIYTMEPTA